MANTELWLDARGRRISPKSYTIEISLVRDQSPVYTYIETAEKESRTVSKDALNEKGGVWLPVRKPEIYCADIFRNPLSISMNEMLIHMLRYSINLPAEIIGMTVTEKTVGMLRH